MTSKRIIVIGGPGNGGVAASCIEDMRLRFGFEGQIVHGFLNDYLSIRDTIHGYPVLGKLTEIDSYLRNDFYFIYAIHSITHAPSRIRLFKSLNIPDERLVTLVHPSAFMGNAVKLGSGVMIMANSYVGPGTSIGKCTFVMANCAIGHDNRIGSFCHFSVGATCSSILEIGDGVDVCLNATILERVKMGDYSVAGSGAMVLKDVQKYEVVVGNPARHLKFTEER